ncbi:hypothetical protein [Acinetobacter sp. MD2(2019)]|uniref:hypothetical protein n=1 Tax=Acinetobacter sp. MD2(2019) TaxID=2605273 RepID=UPI002D1EA367|nr:hypothetical protein [Acinetobacter sp. MD2(2019)]MEB3753830.1 hypothetical protein [Acinetobacter sp. MD2(2019)]
MAEIEPYSTRIEKKLDSIQNDMKVLSDKVLELTIVNRAQEDQSKSNAKRLDDLENSTLQAKGAINLGKLILGIGGGSIIAFLTWIVSQNSMQTQNLANTNQKVAILESKLIRLDTDISVVAKRPPEPVGANE